MSGPRAKKVMTAAESVKWLERMLDKPGLEDFPAIYDYYSDWLEIERERAWEEERRLKKEKKKANKEAKNEKRRLAKAAKKESKRWTFWPLPSYSERDEPLPTYRREREICQYAFWPWHRPNGWCPCSTKPKKEKEGFWSNEPYVEQPSADASVEEAQATQVALEARDADDELSKRLRMGWKTAIKLDGGLWLLSHD